MSDTVERRFPIGAELIQGKGAHFRVWAPKRKRVSVVFQRFEGKACSVKSLHKLDCENDGFFSGYIPRAIAGDLYRFALDDEPEHFPDPASRFQPEGPHGPSEIVNPVAFQWKDSKWPGVQIEGQVIYELHVGTFTPEGNYRSASEHLAELSELGVTLIELMPLNEFAGRFGWGYDGVDLFAPTRLYGTPDELRAFINQAHTLGLGVILDVVYNHLGPDGNYLGKFSDHYFTDKHSTHWGEAINYDGEHCDPVREFFIANAAYWIDEFHFDGLRIDATPEMRDSSAKHILSCITQCTRRAAADRSIVLIGENEPQNVQLIRPLEEDGYGLDALWNDDFHHTATVRLTGRNEAYYSDYLGSPQEFISSAKWGYLYQGQRYKWQKQRRGTPTLSVKPSCFVNFLQNHDQIANSAKGLRIHELSSPGNYRAMTALLLLTPGTPMLFQGQEFGASQPFLYFADHKEELVDLVHKGRRSFLSQFHSIKTEEGALLLSPPHDVETFRSCILDFAERQRHAHIYHLHKDLLELRKSHQAFRDQKYRGLDGAILSPDAFVLRFFQEDGYDTLLLVNFGVDLHFDPAPEPLLAPPLSTRWRLLWSSDDPKYGGTGTPPSDTPDNWWILGNAAIVLIPTEKTN